MAILVADTNEKLRALLALGLYAPDDAVWVLVSQEFYEGKCPSELGDGRSNVDSQFYGVSRPEGVYIVVGRSSVAPSGTPTGNYQQLSDEEFQAWVDYFGYDAFYIGLPEVEDEI